MLIRNFTKSKLMRFLGNYRSAEPQLKTDTSALETSKVHALQKVAAIQETHSTPSRPDQVVG
jgi:hypothetical protein